MDGTDKELRESKFVDELKRVAAGVARNGRLPTNNDQLLAQNTLISRIAKGKGAGSLFSLINVLFAEAMLGDHLSVATRAMERQAEVDFFSTTLSDIVTGRLIIREPLNMLRCNANPEIQALSGTSDWSHSMPVLVRFVVLDSDAVEWLKWHGREMPDWLTPGVKKARDDWASNPKFESSRRRKQASILQDLIEQFGYPPLAIPWGGRKMLESACLDGHTQHFTADGFRRCWKLLLNAKLVRTSNYDICSSKARHSKATR